MFVVLGHAVAHSDGTNEGAKPYSGPVGETKEAAIAEWEKMAIDNQEIASEIQNTAAKLRAAEIDTLISQYGGDEVVIVVKLPAQQIADAFKQ